jgi:hypothetical protein
LDFDSTLFKLNDNGTAAQETLIHEDISERRILQVGPTTKGRNYLISATVELNLLGEAR